MRSASCSSVRIALVYVDVVADFRPVLREEWQFEDRSPQQMVIHSNHLFKGRQSHILGQFWDWPGYDLNDRKQMKELLKEVEIRTVDMGQVEAEVDLASKSRVVES